MKSRQALIFFYFILLLFFFNKAVYSQPPSDYSFQKDDTLLRKKFYEESVAKEKTALENSKKEFSNDYKTAYEDEFGRIKEFWKSSRPVTDPEVNGYLQGIVKRIVDANPELKGTDARVVFSRDWWPNAVSMGDGTIAINAGLFIFLNNESELAFIISHELSHYYLHHTEMAIKKYVETINSKEFQDELKRLSKEQYRVNQQLEKLLKSMAFDSRKHSRDKETEADRKAFDFIKNSGYDCMGIKTCLEMLDKVDDSLFFQKSLNLEDLFNFTAYPFKRKWIEKESSIFSQMKDDDSPLTKKETDSLKTHPDCLKRIGLLSEMISEDSGKGKLFVQDEQEFNKLKNSFYLEMMEQCFRSDNLSYNLYLSLTLLENYPENKTAVYSVVRCLNQVYENQKNHKLGNTIDHESRYFPEKYNLLLRMLDRLRLDEIISLNTNFCKKYYPLMDDYPPFKEEVRKLQHFNN